MRAKTIEADHHDGRSEHRVRNDRPLLRPPPPVSADAATLTGPVKFEGAAPKMAEHSDVAPIRTASRSTRTPATDEDVVVGPAGELANVFVYIKDINGQLPGAVDAGRARSEGLPVPPARQRGHGRPAAADQERRRHAAQRARDAGGQLAVQRRPAGAGHGLDQEVRQAEMTPFKVKCDVHGWMKSYMAVMPHPFYAVSQMNGTFYDRQSPAGHVHARGVAREVRPAGTAGHRRRERVEGSLVHFQGLVQ